MGTIKRQCVQPVVNEPAQFTDPIEECVDACVATTDAFGVYWPQIPVGSDLDLPCGIGWSGRQYRQCRDFELREANRRFCIKLDCITLKVYPDNHPEDISWKLYGHHHLEFLNTSVKSSGNMTTGYEVMPDLTEGMGCYAMVETGMYYQLVVYDAFGDGLCCNVGQGYFEVNFIS